MKDEREYPPELVKSQVLLHTKCIVAMSLWNDDEAKALAERFGAHVLLDKMKLYSELIPAIRLFCPGVDIPEITLPCAKRAKQPFIASIAAA